MPKIIALTAVGLLLLGGCNAGNSESGPSQPQGDTNMTQTNLKLQSDAFTDGERIPQKHAYRDEGQNVSPPLSWSGAPEGVESWALIADDPDAKKAVGKVWTHWVLYNIPADKREIEEGASVAGVSGTTSFEDGAATGWGGPLPPPGSGTHHYHFKLYALDTTLDLPPGADKEKLLQAMEGHILAEAELVGTYER